MLALEATGVVPLIDHIAWSRIVRLMSFSVAVPVGLS